jgi:hypothetical protein
MLIESHLLFIKTDLKETENSSTYIEQQFNESQKLKIMSQFANRDSFWMVLRKNYTKMFFNRNLQL